jgi:hypothetical protein
MIPDDLVALTSVTLDGDLVNVFDPAGTYVGTLFPQSVRPPPRSAGPDGRSEGSLVISLPQS